MTLDGHYGNGSHSDTDSEVTADTTASQGSSNAIYCENLMIAARDGYIPAINTLLNTSADTDPIDVDQTDIFGSTALMLTALNGHVAAATLLLDRDATVDKVNHSGWTALLLAAWHGQAQVVQLLLDRNANKDAQINGMTPLQLAEYQGHTECIGILSNANNINPPSNC